jgi:hypothetical protein
MAHYRMYTPKLSKRFVRYSSHAASCIAVQIVLFLGLSEHTDFEKVESCCCI